MPQEITSLLFVCTGNICRSPTAEGVMRKLAAKAGKTLRVESCATHAYHTGEPPDPRAIAHARARGYDLSAQRARPLRPRDYAEFDLILACDSGHLRILRERAPAASRARIAMLRADGGDVPDPYYGGPKDFETVLDLVEAECARLLREIGG